MTHYLHHIIFDPLSAWESFKVELAVMFLMVPVFVLACGLFGRKK